MSDTDTPRTEQLRRKITAMRAGKIPQDEALELAVILHLQLERELAQARQDGIAEGRRQMPAESVPPLHPVVQECIDNYGKYYAEQHKLDMIYVAQLAIRWADNAAAGSGGQKKLWLWKNFVDGRPEYWAFDNPYPCIVGGGDPQTLGEPCGYAIFKESTQGRNDVSEDEVIAAIKRAIAGHCQPAAPAKEQG